MIIIHLPAKLTADRRLIIDLPADIQLVPGEVQVTISQQTHEDTAFVRPRERLRALLSETGLLANEQYVSENDRHDDETRLISPPAGMSFAEIVNEGRGE